MTTLLNLDRETQQCIETCTACYQACTEAITYSLQKGGEYAKAEHIRLLMDCASVCRTCADISLRGGSYEAVEKACAEVCKKCSEHCDQFDDEILRKCADLCRACSSNCCG